MSQLNRSSQDGEDGAVDFGRLYGAHAGSVLGMCRYLLGSREAAEDATSEVFLKAQRGQESYDTAQPFRHWILGIARHHCLDVLRRRSVEGRIFTDAEMLDPPDHGFGPLTQLLRAERRDTVQAAVAEMPDSFRVPLILRYYEELTYDEIAETLGLTRQNVATLLFRAKQRLRRILSADEMGGSHGLLQGADIVDLRRRRAGG